MNKYADLVYKNGRFYTMDSRCSVKEAVVVKGNKIAFAGSKEETDKYIDKTTEVIDLKGKTVLPGFVEGHLHAPGDAYNKLFNINLYDAHSYSETISIIKDFIRKNPGRKAY